MRSPYSDMPIVDEILDPILPQVSRPARYAGHEWNAIVKDWDETAVRLALLYPDTYEIGMSNLGLMILYDLVNGQPNMLAERAYAPWVDMEAAMREAGIPLFSLESRRPLGAFDALGFSLQYELTYTNILNILDLAGIPLRARDRTWEHPLLIGGGSGAYNPEPLADFIDLFVVGDGENVLLDLLCLLEGYKGGEPRLTAEARDGFLIRAAHMPGVYVPAFYDVSYSEDGRISSITPQFPDLPNPVVRQLVHPLPPAPTQMVVPYVDTIHDRAMIELITAFPFTTLRPASIAFTLVVSKNNGRSVTS